MRLKTVILAGLTLASPAGAQTAATPAVPGDGSASMIAELKTAQGESLGTATAVATSSGMMLITLELSGAPAGIHGIHIHQTGECSPPDFESAGGHLAGGKDHGPMVDGGPHAGDLPNIHVPDSGSLTIEYFAADLKSEDMADEDGSSIILHANPDDYSGQPSGNAGGRIGCGVFSKAN